MYTLSLPDPATSSRCENSTDYVMQPGSLLDMIKMEDAQTAGIRIPDPSSTSFNPRNFWLSTLIAMDGHWMTLSIIVEFDGIRIVTGNVREESCIHDHIRMEESCDDGIAPSRMIGCSPFKFPGTCYCHVNF